MRRRRYVARALEARGIIDLVYETNRLTTRRHPYATQENNNLLRWFHAYVIAPRIIGVRCVRCVRGARAGAENEGKVIDESNAAENSNDVASGRVWTRRCER